MRSGDILPMEKAIASCNCDQLDAYQALRRSPNAAAHCAVLKHKSLATRYSFSRNLEPLQPLTTRSSCRVTNAVSSKGSRNLARGEEAIYLRDLRPMLRRVLVGQALLCTAWAFQTPLHLTRCLWTAACMHARAFAHDLTAMSASGTQGKALVPAVEHWHCRGLSMALSRKSYRIQREGASQSAVLQHSLPALGRL